MSRPKATPMTRYRRLHRWSRKHLGRRFCDVVLPHHPWWDWGHRLMALVGQDQSGNWSAPEPPTWWYRQGPAVRMPLTGFPRHPMRTYQIVKDYREFRALTAGLDEDGMYEWQALNVDQDGELHLGRRYWGGTFYGLRKADVPLLRRYLRRWWLLDWGGARTWLYSLGLHAAVYRRKPFTCQSAPPKGSGGYGHWLCTEKRGHTGPHRYNAMEWGRDPDARVEHRP